MVMASSEAEAAGRPRPVGGDEEEPPAKQLKLCVEDYQILSSASGGEPGDHPAEIQSVTEGSNEILLQENPQSTPETTSVEEGEYLAEIQSVPEGSNGILLQENPQSTPESTLVEEGEYVAEIQSVPEGNNGTLLQENPQTTLETILVEEGEFLAEIQSVPEGNNGTLLQENPQSTSETILVEEGEFIAEIQSVTEGNNGTLLHENPQSTSETILVEEDGSNLGFKDENLQVVLDTGLSSSEQQEVAEASVTEELKTEELGNGEKGSEVSGGETANASAPFVTEELKTEELGNGEKGAQVTGSEVSEGKSANGSAPRAGIVGHSLPLDLDAGTSAVQRTKTSLCSYFRKNGCRHGAACRYAHGEEELKPRPDGSWDPTSQRAKAQKSGGPEGEAPTGEVPEESGTVDTLSKCIVHVPRGWSVDHFKKFLSENSIEYTTAKKRKGMTVAFVGFKTPEDVLKATEILDGKSVNKKLLKVAESRSRSWEKDDRTKSAEGNDGVPSHTLSDDEGVGDLELLAASREGTGEEPRSVVEAVTPLANKTYEEQLTIKRDNIVQILKRLVRNTRKGISSGGLLPEWISNAKDKGGLPCPMEGVLASPLVDGYRNKCEFSIGCSVDGERTVGFQVGSFREGLLAVAEPTDCRNVSRIARAYAAAFQEFVRQSELSVWNKKNNSGFWRLLIVREGRAGSVEGTSVGDSSISEVMLVVQVCPNGIEKEKMTLEYAKMSDFLIMSAKSATPPLPLTALLVQDHVGISNVASADAPLHPLPVQKLDDNSHVANEYIHDRINNLKFQISPTAFFQVNTLAAERLYSLAGDWAGLTPDTLLFDVCCGTGTIGLTLAHRVGLVVGIEMNESAVADAQRNAGINNITNCRFVCSKAEDVMESLLKEYVTEGDAMETEEVCSGSNTESSPVTTADNVEQEGTPAQRKFKNIVAIVDPPRVGLHPVALKTLRLHTDLRRLVYISCNPQSLLANAVELCTPLHIDPNAEKGRQGWRGRANWRGMSNVGQARQRVKKLPPSEAFSPVKAIAVDLFPHTIHCEMVMLFER